MGKGMREGTVGIGIRGGNCGKGDEGRELWEGR